MWGELSSEWGELSSECGASCLGASFLWGELSWGELSLGRVVRNPFRTTNFLMTGFNWISNAPPMALILCAPCLTAAMSQMNTHWKLIRAIIDELEC